MGIKCIFSFLYLIKKKKIQHSAGSHCSFVMLVIAARSSKRCIYLCFIGLLRETSLSCIFSTFTFNQRKKKVIQITRINPVFPLIAAVQVCQLNIGNKKRTRHFSNYSSHCDSLFSFSQTAGTSRFTDISFTLSGLFSAPNRATRRFLGADGSPGMEGTEHSALQADW